MNLDRYSPRPVVRPNLRQRLEFRAARGFFGMPSSWQQLFARRPLVVDGCTLHPQMQMLLTLISMWPSARLSDRSPTMLRKKFRDETLTIAGPTIALGAVSDFSIDGASGTIDARHYVPAGAGLRPLLVYYHGGGFVMGDPDTHDSLCRRLCRDAGVQVLSVNYRLAPEHRFPAAVEDAFAAFRWACAHATALGVLPGQVAVGGDSAGGNLAAVVAQMARADGGAAPCAQILLYPAVDRVIPRPSLDLFGNGFLITRSDIDWYHMQYTGSSVPSRNPRQNPLWADSLVGLAPALIVTAGFDPLRDEGEAYAGALRDAGVPVVLRRFAGMLHGFCSMATFIPACRAALHEITADVRAIIAPETSSDRERSR